MENDNTGSLYGLKTKPDFAPTGVDPADDLREGAKAQKLGRMGVSDLIALNIGKDHAALNVMTQMDIDGLRNKASDAGTEWDALPDSIIQDMNDRRIPLTYMGDLSLSLSQEEYDKRLQVYAEIASVERSNGANGSRGMAAAFASVMTDPVGLAVDAAASIFAGAGAASRLSKVVRAGAAGAAASVAVGRTQRLVDPEYGMSDVLLDATAGAVFGTLFDGMFGRLEPGEKAELQRGMNKAFRDDSASAARVKGSRVDGGLDMDTPEVKGDINEVLEAQMEKGRGLSSVSPSLRGHGTISGVLRNSDSAELKALGELTTPEPIQVRSADGITEAVNTSTVSDFAWIDRDNRWTRFRRAMEPATRAELEAGGVGFFRRHLSVQARQGVNATIGRGLKGFPVPERLQPAVDAGRELLADAWDKMARAGVRGMEGAKKAGDYFPRLARHDLMDRLKTRFKGASDDSVNTILEDLIFRGIKGGRARHGLDFDAALTRKVSKAVLKQALFKSSAPEGLPVSSFDMDYLEDLFDHIKANRRGDTLPDGQTLKENGDAVDGGLTDIEIEQIRAHFIKEKADPGAPSNRLKTRLVMDETVSVKLDDGTQFHLADLYEDDVEKVLMRYNHETSGMAAFAEKGIADHREVKRVYDNLLSTGKINAKEHKAAELLYKHTLGKPLENDPTGTGTRMIRTGMGYAFATQMNQVFWSMLAEFGPVMAIGGFRAMVKQIPAIPDMIHQAVTGEITSVLARQMAAMNEPGTTLIRNTVSLRAADMGHEGVSSGRFGKAADNLSQSAQRLTTYISGLGGVMDFQQIKFSQVFAQRLFDFSKKAKPIPAAWMERLADYGMAAADVDQLMKHMKLSAKAKHGRLVDVGLDVMDEGLQRKLQVLFHRSTKHVIQEADIGATFPWMHTAMVKMFTQFRSFSMVAMHRKTGHALARRDMTAGMSMAFGVGWAAAALAGRTYLNYPEDHKMREKILGDPLTLLKGAFAMTGESSILPMVVDSALAAMDQDAFFGNAYRTTGNASEAAAGIPVVGLGDKAWNTLKTASRAVAAASRGESPGSAVSSKDADAALRMLPFSNALGIGRFNRWLASHFDDERTVQQRRDRRKQQGAYD